MDIFVHNIQMVLSNMAKINYVKDESSTFFCKQITFEVV